MKLIITSTLLLAIIICLVRTEAKKKGLRRDVTLQERSANLKENDDGTIEFPSELKYTIKVDDESTRDLDLVISPFMQLPDADVTRRQKYAFYTDVNTGESFACKVKRINGEVKCQMSGLLERNGETCYISPVSGLAECDESSEDYLNGKFLVLNENGQQIDESQPRSAPKNAERRLKRSGLPDPGFKVVEVCFTVDEAFMIPFYDRNPDDDAEAVEEAELFITLLANEMNVYYSSVKEVSNGELDLAIYPACFGHPGKNNNFAWSQNNIINSGTVLGINADMTLGIAGAMMDFLDYRHDNTLGGRYHHLMGLTGLDLFYNGGIFSGDRSSILGFTAAVGSICNDFLPSISLVENTGFNLGWIASHELGYALGSQEDNTAECPPYINVMSPGLHISPTSSNFFRSFSTCSVNQFISYLNHFPECLSYNSFTAIQFRTASCSGLLGQMDMSLDLQCQVLTGSSTASACSSSVPPFGCYMANAVSCRVTPRGACSSRLTFVWNGTPCGNGKMCYNGNCVSELKICTTTPTRTTTTTTTTTTIPPSCSCCRAKGRRRIGCCRRNYNAGRTCSCCQQ